MRPELSYQAVVIGASAGGLDALSLILSKLPVTFNKPIIIVQHISSSSDGYMTQHLNNLCHITVKEAEDKENILPGTAYIAPANYHILIDDNYQLCLSVDEKVNHSRPSIDVLFESAAYVYKELLCAVVLTGASADGANGCQKIEDYGGMVLVQDPKTASSRAMPEAAIKRTKNAKVLTLEEIAHFLIKNAR
ncbi:MAG: chemotaxis protein CheB [Bacteroidales bacterium]|jgi:two-component system chemotaxis response regulator CheB|nr:chemotaxis protein CheB [Bacteroidales bacterium]